MIITWHGESCIKIQSGETVIYLDPIQQPGFTPPRFSKATIVALTNDTGKQDFPKDTFVVSEPGEYEVAQVFFYAYPWYDNGDRRNIFSIEMEGMTLVHLGNIHESLGDDVLENLEGADVVMVPVGGQGVYDAKKASEVIASIEPRIVIPMSYSVKGVDVKRDTLSPFAKEMGISASEPLDKLKMSARDLPQGEMRILPLVKQ
ncbi:MAG: MBL fold metallo-hydrolase [Candidatus Kerfeldbacteria bacterium]|nr:MBL fold metallo-hydrolase [Candidatus Kerfeldbacteria bacterium]